MSGTRIRGLKLSEELCLVRLCKAAPAGRIVPAFCSLLAESRLNTPYLNTAYRAGSVQAACCVPAADRMQLKRRIDADPVLSASVTFTRGVGLLTLFPHQSNLEIFGRSLRALVKADLKVFGLASSIGALTYVLAYDCLDRAAEILQACFKLDGNHAPFRAEFVVEQGTVTRPGKPE